MNKLKGQTKRPIKNKNERGITLVALIITIIILIILAAVTINALTHDGLAEMAIKGAQDYDQAQQNEMNMLNDIDAMVKETLKNIEDGTTKPKPEEPGTPSNPWDNGNVKEEIVGDISVPVPEDSEVIVPVDDINKGLVIKDSKDNEWVWVPVSEATYNSMFAENSSGIALSGSTGVKTTKYSTSASLIGQNQTVPGSGIGIREPDILTDSGYDNTEYSTAGFSSLQDMAMKMVSEYNTMLESIKKYGGFYIGRYELTENGSKAGTPLISMSWHQLYRKCTELATDNDKGITRMIWRMPVGCGMFVAKEYRI